METVVEVEGSYEEKFEDSVINNFVHNTSPPKQAEDPVMYKLVRVISFLCDCIFLCICIVLININQLILSLSLSFSSHFL